MIRLDHVDHLDRDGLRELVRSLLWQYRLVDAFWFLTVEKRQGLGEAEEINAEVWDTLGRLSARDIKARFGPFPEGLDGLLEAYRYFPWNFMVDYRIERHGRTMTLTVPECPAHQGRARHDLTPYVCKDMHQREFSSFAREIDPRIEVVCLHAPPDPRPENGPICRWRFTMKD